MVSAAIAQGDITAINYFVADKYMKVLTELADSPNQKVLIMPIEVSGVLGSLAGIAEIAKATFGADRHRPRRLSPSAPRRPTVPDHHVTGHPCRRIHHTRSVPGPGSLPAPFCWRLSLQCPALS